jgi:hypothetical protein
LKWHFRLGHLTSLKISSMQILHVASFGKVLLSIPSKRPQQRKNNSINYALRPRRKVSALLSVHTVSFSLYHLQLILRRANLISAPFEFKPSPSASVQFQYIELERFSLFQRYVGRECVWQWLAGTRWENTRECAWPPAPALCAPLCRSFSCN